ncbi:hypothetical protein TPHA_0A04560 [Tetrapisispora phaffii CBS 4417]|uniref:Uncharacterized protein n=1 Tax=Tetrapisispora phaffii (strain ATCC 24235 / CBS 4417 / NBRC 1672 / NRRL Y-8282 / UCD 70-5) TaxID=1071381 RepID=G8BNQ1_TETPH|nr:hypothetical protein TPHA_0A04560 [Tetrapisispora phaffii CBS 4417]CCE61529.1 hypothetical protein TPHA_0A04560 [Tetrapisispora phaffii CBS 4417]
MNRIFGYNNKKSQEQLQNETNKSMQQAQDNLNKRQSQLDTEILQLNYELTNLNTKIKNSKNSMTQTTLRSKAVKILNKRKNLENIKDSLDSQSWNLQQAQLTNDNLTNTMVTVNALRQTKKILQTNYNKINIEEIEALQDDLNDIMEQNNELQDILSQQNGISNDFNADYIDDLELEAELEALEDIDTQDLLNDNMNLNDNELSMPSYLNTQVNIPNFIDDESTALQDNSTGIKNLENA